MFIPWNIWKSNIRFGYWNCGCHKTNHFMRNLVLQVEQARWSYDACFGHRSGSNLKNTLITFLWNSWNFLTRMWRRKVHFLYIRNRAILIITGSNLLNVKYEFMDFICMLLLLLCMVQVSFTDQNGLLFNLFSFSSDEFSVDS